MPFLLGSMQAYMLTVETANLLLLSNKGMFYTSLISNF